MKTCLSFRNHIGNSGGVVIFGGLKPIAAALMNDLNIFSYMDSSFMHTLSGKIEHIRSLRAVDFIEDDDEVEDEENQQFHPHQHATPPLLLLSPPSFYFIFRAHEKLS